MVDKLLLLLGKLIVESTLFFAVSKMWKKRSSIYSAVRWRIWEHSDNNCVYMKQIDLGSQQIPIFSLLHSKLSSPLAIPSSEVWWCDQNRHPKGVWILAIHTLSSLDCWMYQVWWGKEGCIRTYPSGSPGFHTHASPLSSCKGSPTSSRC